ncbi:MAG: recombinase family protein [Rhodospirillaceae bacterium]|nr:recombinase family protein [Rhodospirillaceae bacterium]
MGKQAAIYVRVSTARQAEKDLSIPDQRRQAEAYCKARDINTIQVFEEPGASAMDDKRPVFQAMIDQATEKDRPFDLIVVHSFSRFFRDSYLFEYYRRKLEKNGVGIVSITQEVNDDPMGDIMRKFATLMDEYSSKENAKHVLRAMRENTRQGFWNGGPPPYGYRSFTVSVRGGANKKKLEINPTEAESVLKIFDLFEQGDGNGPMGVRNITKWLYRKGLNYRKGRRWSSGLVHAVLTNSTLKGEHYFNRKTFRNRRRKDRAEWEKLETPIIIQPETFDRVRRTLESRRPSNTPPREVNGPTLLTGRVKCENGSGMSLRTGKSGKYRYYTCQKHAHEGGCDCKRHSYPMDKLDEIVIGELEARILVPDRLKAMLGGLLARGSKGKYESAERQKALDKERRVIEANLDRLYTDRAEGILLDTPTFRRKVSEYEHRLDEIIRIKSQMTRRRDMPTNLLAEKNLDHFTQAIRAKLRGDNPAFRKAYVRHLVDRVDVTDHHIRITGSKQALLAGLISPANLSTSAVPSFVREWWAQ